jgi:hypothetical protein
MNNSETPSRWVRDLRETSAGPATSAERAVMAQVLGALRSIRHGTVEISVQDGKPVQINTTEKKRL